MDCNSFKGFLCLITLDVLKISEVFVLIDQMFTYRINR